MFSFSQYKNGTRSRIFGENSIIKSAFHKSRKLIDINEVDIKGIALSNKKLLSKDSLKYFFGYSHEGNAF